MTMETGVSKLRKRKVVEYNEDDDNDTPKKKPKTVKEKVVKPAKPKSTSSGKRTNEVKKVAKTKTTKVSEEEIHVYDDCESVPNIWNEADMLAQVEKIPHKLAENLINLLTEGCTLPFIARYRKTAVDNLMPDR